MLAAEEEVERDDSGDPEARQAEEAVVVDLVLSRDPGGGGGALGGVGAVEGRVGYGGAPGPAHLAAAGDVGGRQTEEDLQDHVVRELRRHGLPSRGGRRENRFGTADDRTGRSLLEYLRAPTTRLP